MTSRHLKCFVATLALLCALPVFSQSMPAQAARPAQAAPPAIGKSQPTGLDVLRQALTKVCSRHPAVERCFLMLAQGSDQKQAGIWFIPIFDGAVDNTALGEAQQAFLKLFPNGGQLPMMLLPRDTWRKQTAGVSPIYVRKAKP
jgi:invasion protein IalB